MEIREDVGNETGTIEAGAGCCAAKMVGGAYKGLSKLHHPIGMQGVPCPVHDGGVYCYVASKAILRLRFWGIMARTK